MTTEKPQKLLGQLLVRRKLTLGTAESCTGGLIGDLLTDVAGSSEYFLGGAISYSNDLKMRLLGVNPDTLEAYGAVSEQTALEMARGARQNFQADIGLSVTGIAGPGGGTETKPVGLTYVGISTDSTELVREFVWTGNRRENKLASARAALELVIEILAS